uniref:RNA-directed DNA polymerase, eukaryota n=1 Tax=Tanacetum cinerariifolium TaxID=118510 RepID=A0A6L2MH78_TANCI|nr:RNA-directed DNA polymerase, eukaryota [Tanacetum cinerariifolium]
MKILLISVYAPQSLSVKRLLWNYLSSLITRWNEECLVMGDFNEVRRMKERWGLVFNARGADVFNSFISGSGLTECQLEGIAKSDLLLNNIDEVFNGKIVRGRDKPMITLLEYIREYCMKRIVDVQSVIDKCTGSNNAEAIGSASRQAQQAEPLVGQDGLGGSGVGVVIGLSVADGAGGAGVGVGSQEVPLNNNIRKQSGDLVEMPSEAVEQEMDDHIPGEIDGAKGEQVLNHVVKKGNFEFLVCKQVVNHGGDGLVYKERPLKRKRVYAE